MRAIIFDLDGVITRTADLHAKAWKEAFDPFLFRHSEQRGEPYTPFDLEGDYLNYVDGRPRYDGVRTFFSSRGITLPEGKVDDAPHMDTIYGIGNRKNRLFNELLTSRGVEVYPSTVALIHRCIQEGIAVGVASSSKNCRLILESVGLTPFIATRVDGEVSLELGLSGKPAPDIFLKAAENLGVHYSDCVVVEDAASGVMAARSGNFGLVIGLARKHNEEELYAHGADVVVADLEDFDFSEMQRWFQQGLSDDNWRLVYHGYDPEKERSREALLSVGNGLFGTRGAFEECGPDTISYPGTYMAGVYNKLASTVEERVLYNEDLVNVTNWLPVTFKVNDNEWVDLHSVKTGALKRTLNLRDGLLTRSVKVYTPDGGEYQVVSSRFASMHNPHLAALRYEILVLKTAGDITLKVGLHGNHINDGVERYRDLNQVHLKPVKEYVSENLLHVEVATTGSELHLRQTARAETFYNGVRKSCQWSGAVSPGIAEATTTFSGVKAGDTIVVEKYVHLAAAEEKGSEPNGAMKVLQTIESFDQLHSASAAVWDDLWSKADIQITGDRLAQKLIRLHIYHLLCTTSPHNTEIDAGIPARGLTGEAYRGHIFWDEVYILPFYFIHLPEVARSVLMYRYRRLDAARSYANELGFAGAMFPWQSGSTGEEETQRYHYNPTARNWGPDNSSLQRHVSLAVAWNIIQYHHVTHDNAFMQAYGMEMLIEIARCWRSQCKLNSSTGRYSIEKVMGPDEFHEGYPNAKEAGLRDNAYTNVLVAWLFNKMAALFDQFIPTPSGDNNSDSVALYKELDDWLHIAKHLSLVISQEGIIAQFDGYFELEELDFASYKERYGNIYRLDRILKAEGRSPNQYQVAKQADTLMLFYLLPAGEVTRLIREMGYQLPDDYITKNFDYYMARTTHGSTLSRVVHAKLAHLNGKRELAWSLFREALVSDYHDTQGGTTGEGIHTGVMASTVWLALTMYGGLDLSTNQPMVMPELPPEWRTMKYRYKFRDQVHWEERTST